MILDRRYIDIWCVHPLSYEERSFRVEALIARSKGLAVTPFKGAGLPLVLLDQSEQWVLTHLASGRQVGDPFPANEHLARAFLSEVCSLTKWNRPLKEILTEWQSGEALERQVALTRGKVEQALAVHQPALFATAEGLSTPGDFPTAGPSAPASFIPLEQVGRRQERKQISRQKGER